MTRVSPSFVQVMVAVVESAVQYSQITDCSTMLWTPLLFWKRMSGRGVTISWAPTAKDGRRRREGRENEEGREEEGRDKGKREKEWRGEEGRKEERSGGEERRNEKKK